MDKRLKIDQFLFADPDLEFLSTLQPKLEDFEKHIRETRWNYIGVAVIFAACGIGLAFTSEPPNYERKFWAGVIVAAISLLSAAIAFLAPARWIKSYSVFNQQPDLELVLEKECPKSLRFSIVNQIKEQWIQLAICLPIVFIGLAILQSSYWGLALVIPSLAVVVLRNAHIGMKPSHDFFEYLTIVLKQKKYRNGFNFGKQQLLGTFVNQDLSLDVMGSMWKHFDGGIMTWFHFGAGGNSPGSGGIACAAVFHNPLSLMEVLEVLSNHSSRYFDRESNSIYGTFNSDELLGVPWQYQNGQLIFRWNESLVKGLMQTEAFNLREYCRNATNAVSKIIKQLELVHPVDTSN